MKNRVGFVVPTILLALVISVVNAAVFVYYPINITAVWTLRPIRFEEGTNAGGPDLGPGNTITVTLTEEKTSAAIKVHPSRRGTTYYKDVLRIVNGDARAYFIGFVVIDPFVDTAVVEAQLIVRTLGGVLIGTVNLKATGTTWVPWELGAGDQFRIDLRFIVSSATPGSEEALINLVYSPQSIEPPP